MVKGDSPLNEGEVGASTIIFEEVFIMFKKKTWSTLLSLIVTLAVLISCTGTVMADPVDPEQGDKTAQTEQAEQADPAKSEDPADPEKPADPADAKDAAKAEDPADTNGDGDSAEPANQKSRSVSAEPAMGGEAANDGETGTGTTTDPNDPSTQISNENSGYFGDGLFWEVDYGTLTISGQGAMPDYISENSTPWYYCINTVEDIVIEEGITYIGDNTFAESPKVESVTFPSSSLKGIGDFAFQSCGNITSVQFPNSVTSIGNHAFRNCTKLESVRFPENLTTIGEHAFDTTKIKSFYLPQHLTSIGQEAFANCNNINYVYFPSNVTAVISVGDGAFSNCSQLQYCYMYDSVKSIGKQIFKNSALYSFAYPAAVKTVAEESFAGCTDLHWVDFSENLETIETNAFNGCSELTKITINDSVKSIAAGAFIGCSKLATVNAYADPSKLTWGASASDFIENKGTKCIVPGRYYDAYVAKFGSLNLDFDSNTYGSGTCGENLTWIVDGDGTMIISGTGPMYDYVDQEQPWYNLNSKIERVVVESGVTSIGDYAFGNVFGSLRKVTLSDTVKSIGSYAFYYTNNLEGIVLPEGLTTIKSHAFEDSAIKSVNIPTTVTAITEAAFKNCNMLEAIDLHDNITTIEKAAFAGTQNLRTVTIPGSVTNWGTSTFSRSGISSVTVCEGITRIPNSTFYSCIDLSEVNLPNSVTAIGDAAFYVDYEQYVGTLESITLPSNLTTIGNWAFCGQAFRSITIPGSVTTITTDAFTGCSSLNTIVIQKGVVTIEEGAFNYCPSIRSVSIPSTVTSIGYRAFSDAFNLRDIYMYPGPANLRSFDYYITDNEWDSSNLTNNTKIHVLESYLEDYKIKYSNIQNLFVGDLDPNGEAIVDIGSGVHLYGYTLSLTGDIGVNFWFKLSEDNLDENNYIKFTVNGKDQIVKVSEASTDEATGAKIFRCSVVAKQMTDTIEAQFYAAEGYWVGMKYSYTIKEYANYILTHSNYSAHDKNIAKAMLNYGACTQKYFNYKADSLANSVLSASEQEVTIKNYQDIYVPTSNASQAIEPAMVSLVLNTTITLKLYFHPSDLEGVTVKNNNEVLEVTTSGDFKVVKFEGISAAKIHTFYNLTFFGEGNEFLGQSKFCPNQYIRLILSQPDNDPVFTDDLKRLVSALYEFNLAVKA